MKRTLSLTTRFTFLFAFMACGLLVLMAVVIDRSVSAHFDELDLYDLSAKRIQLETLVSHVKSDDDLERLPTRISDAFVGHETVALLINLSDPSWQYALNADRFSHIQNMLNDSKSAFHKWETAEGVRFIGQAATLKVETLGSSELNLWIGIDISHHVHFLDQLRLFLTLGILGATLLAGLLGWFVAHKGLAPLRKVASTARKLSAQHLGERLSTGDAPSEMQEFV